MADGKKFEEKLKTLDVSGLTTIPRVSAGWLKLVGREVVCELNPNDLLYGPPSKWRKKPSVEFFDWMAYHAATEGWDRAVELALEEADKQQLGHPYGVGGSIPELRRWLQEQWDSPPIILQELLNNERLLEAGCRSRSADWISEETYQAMKGLALGRGRLSNFQQDEALTILYRSPALSQSGAVCAVPFPHMTVHDGRNKAIVWLGGDYHGLPAGYCQNGEVWYGHDRDGNETSGLNTDVAGIDFDRLKELVNAAVRFWDQEDSNRDAA